MAVHAGNRTVLVSWTVTAKRCFVKDSLVCCTCLAVAQTLSALQPTCLPKTDQYTAFVWQWLRHSLLQPACVVLSQLICQLTDAQNLHMTGITRIEPCRSCTAGEDTYMTDVNTYYSAHLANEATMDAELITDWDNLFWASNVLLANITADSASSGSFHQATQAFLKQWVCGSGGVVK